MKLVAARSITRVSTHEHEHWEHCLCTQSLLKTRVFEQLTIAAASPACRGHGRQEVSIPVSLKKIRLSKTLCYFFLQLCYCCCFLPSICGKESSKKVTHSCIRREKLTHGSCTLIKSEETHEKPVSWVCGKIFDSAYTLFVSFTALVQWHSYLARK